MWCHFLNILIYSWMRIFSVYENFLCASPPMHTCALVCAPMWRLEDYLNSIITQSACPPSLPPFFPLISFQGKAHHWPGEICLSLYHQPWDLNVGHHAPLLCKGGFCGWNLGPHV